MAITYLRGHKISFDKKKDCWIWDDTNEPVTDDRPCKKCGCYPDERGNDACIGNLFGVDYACCGHGVFTGYFIKNGNKIDLK